VADLDPPKPGEVLHGQLLDKDFRVKIPFTQQVQNFKQGGSSPNLNSAGYEITPIDANSTEDKHFDYTALDAAKLALFWQNPTFISFSVPDELTALTPIFATSKGTGSGTSTPTAVSSGSTWSVSVTASNQGSSSLDYLPDLQPSFKTFDTSNVPAIECYFFTSESSTLASILTLLTTKLGDTVLAWPAFRPALHTFTLIGQSLDLSCNASIQLSASASSGNTSGATNGSTSIANQKRTSIRSFDITRPVLHGALTISPSSASDTVSVTAGASVTASGSASGTAGAGDTVGPVTITASISPTSLSATSPAAVPTSGLYLKEIVPQANDGDLFLQRAIVVDFAYFA
jgi:hypothetical protein